VLRAIHVSDSAAATAQGYGSAPREDGQRTQYCSTHTCSFERRASMHLQLCALLVSLVLILSSPSHCLQISHGPRDTSKGSSRHWAADNLKYTCIEVTNSLSRQMSGCHTTYDPASHVDGISVMSPTRQRRFPG
jgi:hypothetical protein